MKSVEFARIDYEGFRRELDALRETVDKQLGAEDLRHLRKIEGWGRACTLLGYATAWILPKPVSAWLISQGNFTRWTMMMHHVGHRAYDKIPGVAPRHTSAVFARGGRRFVDFPDWIEPESWLHEHNLLHHYHTGEKADPDMAERNVMALRQARLPAFLKLVVVVLHTLSWKWAYYGANTLRALKLTRNRPAGSDLAGYLETNFDAQYSPSPSKGKWTSAGLFRLYAGVGREVVTQSLVPYVLYRFVAIPALFLVISPEAALYVLLTSLLAEVINSIHTFMVIVPNHCGDDLYRFDAPVTDKAEFYVRQVLGSVDYRTGSDLNDFLHGWLNYQIEHHLWPDLPLLRYQQLQPRVQALCAKYRVPYVQQGVLRRFWKAVQVMTGMRSMPVAATLARSRRAPGSVPHATSAKPAAADVLA